MTNIVVCGCFYGDEGKGKIVDFLSEKSDYVVRYQGGSNAGHTLNDGKNEIALHLIPSGILRKKTCVLGNGMVLNLDQLKKEIKEVKEKFNINAKEYLMISGGAHLVLPEQIEASKHDVAGGTNKGIGPTYAKKHAYNGFRVYDIINPLDEKDPRELNKIKDYLSNYKEFSENIKNVSYELNEAISNNKNILFEGAQATGLDIDHGEYPFVTSSNPTSAGACTGTGIAPKHINKVVGICKAYLSRVDSDGRGPMVTEFNDAVSDSIREHGKEYGATTGRPRRIGWFDMVMLKHSVRVNGLDHLVITRLDILDIVEKLKICVKYEIDGKETDVYPADGNSLRRCKPIYEELPGWKSSTKGVTNFDELPENAKKYLRRIEELSNVKIAIISTGPERNSTIILNDVWN